MKEFYKEYDHTKGTLTTLAYAKHILGQSNQKKQTSLPLSQIVQIIKNKKIENNTSFPKVNNATFQQINQNKICCRIIALKNDGKNNNTWHVVSCSKSATGFDLIINIKNNNKKIKSLICLQTGNKDTRQLISVGQINDQYSLSTYSASKCLRAGRYEISNEKPFTTFNTPPTCITPLGIGTFACATGNQIRIVSDVSSQPTDDVVLDLKNQPMPILAITNVTLNQPNSSSNNEQSKTKKVVSKITYITKQEIVIATFKQVDNNNDAKKVEFSFTNILNNDESAIAAKSFTTPNETFILIVAKNNNGKLFIYKIDPSNLQNKQKIAINDETITDVKQITILPTIYPYPIALLDNNSKLHLLYDILPDKDKSNEYTYSSTTLENKIDAFGIMEDNNLVVHNDDGYLSRITGDTKNSIHRQLNQEELTKLLSSAPKNSDLYLGIDKEIERIEALTTEDEKTLEISRLIKNLNMLPSELFWASLEKNGHYEENVLRIFILINNHLDLKWLRVANEEVYNFIQSFLLMPKEKERWEKIIKFAVEKSDTAACMVAIKFFIRFQFLTRLKTIKYSVLDKGRAFITQSDVTEIDKENYLNNQWHYEFPLAANELLPRNTMGDKQFARLLQNYVINPKPTHIKDIFEKLIANQEGRKQTLIEFFIQFGSFIIDGYTALPLHKHVELMRHNFNEKFQDNKDQKELLLGVIAKYVDDQLKRSITATADRSENINLFTQFTQPNDSTLLGYFSRTLDEVIYLITTDENQNLYKDLYKNNAAEINQLLSRIIDKLNEWITDNKPSIKDAINAYASLFESSNKNQQFTNSESMKQLCVSLINYMSNINEQQTYDNFATIKKILATIPFQCRDEKYHEALFNFINHCVLACLPKEAARKIDWQMPAEMINKIKEEITKPKSPQEMSETINNIYQQNVARVLTLVDKHLGYKEAYEFTQRMGWKKKEYDKKCKEMFDYAAQNNYNETCMTCVRMLAWHRCFSRFSEFNPQLFLAANELFPRTSEGDQKIAEILKNNKIAMSSPEVSHEVINIAPDIIQKIFKILVNEPKERQCTLVEFFTQFGSYSLDNFGINESDTVIPGASGQLISHNFLKIADLISDQKLLLDLISRYVERQFTHLIIPVTRTSENYTIILSYFTGTFNDVICFINKDKNNQEKINQHLSHIIEELNKWITKNKPSIKDTINTYASLFESINKNQQFTDAELMKQLCSSLINYMSSINDQQSGEFHKNHAAIKKILTTIPSPYRDEKYHQALLNFMKGYVLACLSNAAKCIYRRTTPKTIEAIKTNVKNIDSLEKLEKIINSLSEQKTKAPSETPQDSPLGKNTNDTYETNETCAKIFNETKCNETIQKKVNEIFNGLQHTWNEIKKLIPTNNLILEHRNANKVIPNEIAPSVPLLPQQGEDQRNANDQPKNANTANNNNINIVTSPQDSSTKVNNKSLQNETNMPPLPTVDELLRTLKTVTTLNKKITSEKKALELRIKRLEEKNKQLEEENNRLKLEKQRTENHKPHNTNETVDKEVYEVASTELCIGSFFNSTPQSEPNKSSDNNNQNSNKK